MSDTPRTDAVVDEVAQTFDGPIDRGYAAHRYIAFAAELERELAEAREALNTIATYGGQTLSGLSCNGSWCAEQAARALDSKPAHAPDRADVGCSHDWKEPVDSQFSNETHTEVKCTKCGMVGEKTIATGEVFFPAT